MERKGGIYDILLTILYMMSIHTGCVREVAENDGSGYVPVRISVQSTEEEPESKSIIHDGISLIVFNQDGLAERCIETEDGSVRLNLIAGRSYSFYAFANFGYPIFADHISEMDELMYHHTGGKEPPGMFPMCGKTDDITITEEDEIRIMMDRLYAEVRVVMDRSLLSDGVSMKVTGIKVCNSPKSVKAFRSAHGTPPMEGHEEGMELDRQQVEALNTIDTDGLSGEVVLHALENMQEDGSVSGSYLEISLDYLSFEHFTNGGPLIYRAYIGEGPMDRKTERNSIYRMTILPEGNGLNGNDWQVDRKWLAEFGPSRFAAFPESYIRGDIGDTLHLWCEFYPPHAGFDVGIEELEYDKAQGIYDYIIDEDGHGVRLILKNPGTGLVYMKAGEPVNEAAMWIVEVNMPHNREGFRYTLQYMTPDTTATDPVYLRRQDVRLHPLLQGRDL